MSNETKNIRRQVVVDKAFQLQFLGVWILIGLAMTVLSGGFYIVVRRFSGAQYLDPFVMRVLLGMSIFIILFCTLMGLISLLLSHRVAGAAYRIERSLDRMLGGDFNEPVKLRKGDYLHRLADRLNHLQERIRGREKMVSEAMHELSEMRNRLSASEQPAMDNLIAKMTPAGGDGEKGTRQPTV